MDKPLGSLPQKTCQSCEKLFTPNSGQQRNCSLECYRRKYYRRPEMNFPKVCYCGNSFATTHGNKKYCSSECMWKNMGEKRKKQFQDMKAFAQAEILKENLRVREEFQKKQTKDDVLLEAQKMTAIEQQKLADELEAWEKGEISKIPNPMEEK